MTTIWLKFRSFTAENQSLMLNSIGLHKITKFNPNSEVAYNRFCTV